MIKNIRYIILLCSISLSSEVLSWNTYGQLALADTAISHMTPSKQREFDLLAYKLVRQMDSQKRLYLMRTFEGTSAFAHAAVFPDDWRGLTATSLFDQYGDGLPTSMAKYADSTTTDWHFINQPYNPSDNAPVCEVEEENFVSVLPDLIVAYRESSSENNRALLLSLIIHLVSDAHNPMHTITRVNDDCESDLGGTRFCVSRYSGSLACEENLQQIWDRGLGFFNDQEKIEDSLAFLSRVEVAKNLAEITDPKIWAEEGLALARTVYSANESALDPYYVDEGRIISYERAALGAIRLALILEQL